MKNTELEFRHKKTGCGARILVDMKIEDIRELREILSLPGLDLEVTALAYPYQEEVK